MVISFINLTSPTRSFPGGLRVFVIGFVILLVGALGANDEQRK
jgi:hypothetical protein